MRVSGPPQQRRRLEKSENGSRLREADALVGQAHGTRYSRRPGQRFEALTALGKAADIGRELGQPPEWFARLRNEAIAALRCRTSTSRKNSARSRRELSRSI